MKVVFATGGKGGVGKSMVSVNLAYALVRSGKKVGILDADIPSPNIAEFFKIKDMSVSQKHEIETVKLYDGKMQIFSMGGMATNQSISMRESDYANLIRDVVKHGDWDCDILIVDLPAGSSEVMKSVTAIFADTIVGNIVVSSPAHTRDASRVLRWHEINGVRVLGVIENMSYFECHDCKKKYKIFGESNIADIVKKHHAKLLGSIPISLDVRKSIVEQQGTDGQIGKIFDKIAKLVIATKPQRPGFLTSILKKGKGTVQVVIIKAFIQMLKIANTEVNIGNIQEQQGYVGGRDIRINIMDDELKKTIQTINLILKEKQLRILKRESHPKVIIGIKAKALADSLLGYRKTSYGDKVGYTLFDAYLNQDCVVSGEEGDSLVSLKFIKETWEQVQQRENGRVTKMLEKIL